MISELEKNVTLMVATQGNKTCLSEIHGVDIFSLNINSMTYVIYGRIESGGRITVFI